VNYILSIFLLPLLAAYLFLITCVFTRFFIIKSKGTHLILYLSLACIATLYIAFISLPVFDYLVVKTQSDRLNLYHSTSPLIWLWESISNFLNMIDPKHFSQENKASSLLNKVSSLTIVVSFILIFLSAVIEKCFPRVIQFMDNLVARRSGGNLGKILNDFSVSATPALITLDSKKVYVGYILKLPNWGADKKDLIMLPLYSGFRDENHHLKITNDYGTLWNIFENKGSSKGILIKSESDQPKEVELSSERADHILANAAICIKFEDIVIVSEWLTELYDIHNFD
jgi:hypothetical protein